MNITNIPLIDDLIYKKLHQSYMNNLNLEFNKILNKYLNQLICANSFIYETIHSAHERNVWQHAESGYTYTITEKRFLYKNGFKTFEYLNDVAMNWIVRENFTTLFFKKNANKNFFPFTISTTLVVYFYYKIENGNIVQGDMSGRVNCNTSN